MFQPIKDLKNKTAEELENLFKNHFDKLAMKYSYYNVFENFLDMAINGFCFNYDSKLMDYCKEKYTQDERYYFGELIYIWIFLCNKKIPSDDTFFDWLGSFYERNAMTKEKGFAQFFTPVTICIFMAKILGVEDSSVKNICEPCCGSGRFNLAIHAVNPKMFHVATDLDLTCVKMAGLNFMLHGIKGIVICDNSLFPGTSFRGAFIINQYMAPSIKYITDVNEAYSYASYKVGKKKEHLPSTPSKDLKEDTAFIQEQYKVIADKKGQFALF